MQLALLHGVVDFVETGNIGSVSILNKHVIILSVTSLAIA